jgi:UDP-N-acetylmuramoyl-tripeptide--D-alanyl-D-alanine ligase
MKPLTLQQVRLAVGGRALSGLHTRALTVSAVCIDSRRMEPGSLFVAIKGDTHDGHNHLPQAAAGGAVAALVQTVPDVSLPNLHFIHVPDTRAALGKLARYVRQRMTCKVIGVGGSNGKTSTKHLIDAALSAKLRGSISPKSFNNDIGVPLTIFPADPNQDYLVLEMGTNHHGEMRALSEMALPDIAVITNVGAEHLEGLGDLMGVRREEASIVKGLNPRGLLVVNGDDAELLDAVAEYPGKRVTFGFKESNDLFASNIRCDEDGTRFNLNNSRREVFVPMLGRHTAANALAAIAVARRLGVDESDIIASLAEARGPEMRLQMIRAGEVTVLNDAYNANPSSMRAAIETLCALPCDGRRVAVVGDMRELGKASDRYHRELGEQLAACGLDLVVCIGAHSTLTADAARRAKLASERIWHFPDATSAARSVPGMLRPRDLVLIKASRSLGLEQVAEAIQSAMSQPAGTGRGGKSDARFFRKAAS